MLIKNTKQFFLFIARKTYGVPHTSVVKSWLGASVDDDRDRPVLRVDGEVVAPLRQHGVPGSVRLGLCRPCLPGGLRMVAVVWTGATGCVSTGLVEAAVVVARPVVRLPREQVPVPSVKARVVPSVRNVYRVCVNFLHLELGFDGYVACGGGDERTSPLRVEVALRARVNAALKDCT